MTQRTPAILGVAVLAVATVAQTPASQLIVAQAPGGRGGGPPVLSGPAPTHAEIDYAPADPAGSNGHKLDLYLPAAVGDRVPVVIWTGGSAWMADTGKRTAPGIAAHLVLAGYAVAGVSI